MMGETNKKKDKETDLTDTKKTFSAGKIGTSYRKNWKTEKINSTDFCDKKTIHKKHEQDDC